MPPAEPFPSGTHHTLGPPVSNATLIAMGPYRMARLPWYIVTLGCPSETGEFTEWAHKATVDPNAMGLDNDWFRIVSDDTAVLDDPKWAFWPS